MARDPRPPLYRYGFTLLVTAAALALRALLSSALGTDFPFILFFPTVTLCAWYGGLGPGLLATAFGGLAAPLLDLGPLHRISLSNPREAVALTLFLSGGSFISWVCGSLRALVTSRDETLAAARASEARHRTLFEATQDGIMIVNDEGRYVEVNESLCRLLKAPREQIVGSHFSRFIPPDVLGEAEKDFDELKRFSAFRGEFPLLAADGTVVELDWTSRANFLPGLHFCTAREIGARKLREAHDRFLAGASAALASSLDFETTLGTVARLAVPHFADWCAVDVSDEDGRLRRLAVAHVEPGKVARAHELYERYPPDPSAELGLYHVLRTGESEFYPEVPDEMLRQGARDPEHLDILRQLGFRSVMLVPLRARQRTLGVLTFANSDPGRRHHTREDLALAEELARRAALAVDNAGLYRAERQTREAAERTSDRLLRLQKVSGVLSQALTPQEVAVAVVEQGVHSLGAHAGTVVRLADDGAELELVGAVGFPPDLVEKWRRFPVLSRVPLADAVRRKEPVLVGSFADWQDNYPQLGPLGQVTGSHALVAFPLVVEGRTIGAMGLSFREVRGFTDDDHAFLHALAQQCAQSLERARLYEAAQRARAEAEAANRLKDEFLATVSHELRTPLTAILGWARMLMAGGLDAQLTARAVETIDRNARSQNQLIEDLLDVSRIITGKLRLDVRPVELSPVVSAAVEAVRPAAEGKEIRLHSALDPGAGPVSGDPERLQQVVWNLISNAVKFTPRGGRVEVLLRRADPHVEIAVSDTGSGIAPEFLPYVFDRFRQADATTRRGHGGLGLGLSIVRHLVELHGGTVRAESQGEGRGATFTVVLPLVRPREPAAGEGRGLAPAGAPAGVPFDYPPRLDGLRVLVVDDERDARELLTAILRGCGADVRAAASAADALAALRESRPDVLVSDIGMPGEDGYDLIQKVRALEAGQATKLPAVALTAYAKVEDRIRALSAGFHAHVTKPVEPMELAAVIASLAGRRPPPE